MSTHIFTRLPRYCDSMRPGLLTVRCPGWHGHKCGRPHKEYFGPRDRNEQAAKVRFLEQALALAFRVADENAKRGMSHAT